METRGNFISQTVLIVDDNARMRSMLREMLRPLTKEIIESSSGEDAIESYRNHRTNLVLMDVRMEGMSGIEATRVIKRHDPKATVVILTQYDDVELRTAAAEAGACGYFIKDRLHELKEYLEHFDQSQE